MSILGSLNLDTDAKGHLEPRLGGLDIHDPTVRAIVDPERFFERKSKGKDNGCFLGCNVASTILSDYCVNYLLMMMTLLLKVTPVNINNPAFLQLYFTRQSLYHLILHSNYSFQALELWQIQDLLIAPLI